ncbi:PEP-CTERM sorting domain-containing protein [Crocosphaera sp. UHCC 0190]|uniref:PEP-CTERM sorting domain-containing protein n=1 Tax=Crocosphaera sp. UHCC 0190 TaxID=3110246 RepID=UPI002B1FC235|nr:PEP-CTERM sorting domain-containing protein [Crocosphaera sp. UHCC 0190]MEA5511547.1 PEP-CTERM sorting domain-containing protein [Crocosphaera sp. UHCC 0190]
MTYSVAKFYLTAVAIAATSSLIPTSFVQAATVSYIFTGTLDSGSLNGETYSGSLSFDDLSLDVIDFNFSFLGSTFTIADADTTPRVLFDNGQFLGLDYVVSNFNPSFSFIPGFFSIDEAYFAYDSGNSGAGFGSINYYAVPEPLTILGSLTALGFGAFFKRKLS